MKARAAKHTPTMAAEPGLEYPVVDILDLRNKEIWESPDAVTIMMIELTHSFLPVDY